MEKKKLLLVAVSVGMVLLIIIFIPLVLLSPRQRPATPQMAVSPAQPRQENPRVIIDPPGPMHLTDSSTEQPTIVQQPQGTTQPEITPQSNPVEAPRVTTITVPAPRTVAVPDAPVSSTPRTAAPARPTTAPVPTARPQAQTVARPAETPRATYTNYWVQTGAFSTKVRAEGAKESLESKGITSIIDNRDINGKTWYRVRVGPYISETEANYWLALVKSIDGFTDSIVLQGQALR
jgi:DedD protein